MNIKECISIINEENGKNSDAILSVYYILRHLVYDETEPRENFVLGELVLGILENIKSGTDSIQNVVQEFI